MYQYAIFDLDDTILDFDAAEQVSLTRVLKNHGVTDLSHAETFYQAYNQVVWQQIERGADRDQLLNQRFTHVLGQLGITVNGAAVQAEYDQLLGQGFQILPGARDLLTRLKAANVTIIIGTNGIQGTQLKRIAGAHLNDLLDHVFISEAVGYAKPDHHFFDAIFHHYPKMTTTNAIMVGDSVRSDITGAANVHLPNIWYNPNHATNIEPVLPTYTASNFTEVQQIILNDKPV